jgi:hypothetical protein
MKKKFIDQSTLNTSKSLLLCNMFSFQATTEAEALKGALPASNTSTTVLSQERLLKKE